MFEDTNTIENLEDDAIMPDDYDPGKDIFEQADENPTTDQTEAKEILTDGEPSLEEYAAGIADAAEDDTQSETDEPKDRDNGSGEGTEESETEEPPTTEEPKQTVKVRFNHEDLELTTEQAAQYAQKGLNYDKVLERLQQAEARNANADEVARVLGYDSADAMFAETRESIREQRVQKYVNDDGIPEPLARYLVEQEVSKEERAAKDFVESSKIPVETPAEPPAPEKKPLVSDADMTAFVKAHPGVTKLPAEVVTAVMNGVNISAAYAEYESKKDKEELRILKQNQAAAAKAPVSGVSKHGNASAPAKRDPFAEGFDSDVW